MHECIELAFNTISCEGNLFPPAFLQRLVQKHPPLEGLTPETYHLDDKKLNEAINDSWMTLLQKWHVLRKSYHPDDNQSLKETWIFPLFDALGYGRRLPTAKSLEIEGKKYPITHGWGHVPIHIVGAQTELDARCYKSKGSNIRQSPHMLVQELLNRSSEHIWGIVTNGLRLRLLRHNKQLVHRTYIEFDLELMMQSEAYADFAVLWLLCHQSRFESERAEDCWLEHWSRLAHDQSIRALGELRHGIEKAVLLLGQGFLTCRANQQLREKLRSGTLKAEQYYRQLLRLIYRLLVLFIAEDRELLLIPGASEEAKTRYTKYYSMACLRQRALKYRGTQHVDLFRGLCCVMQQLAQDPGYPDLALPTLDGFLFESAAMPDLAACDLTNACLLEVVRSLAFLEQMGRLKRIDFQHLGAEELGNIYEGILEFQAVIEGDPPEFRLEMKPGHMRKTTGSFYTPPQLIESLLNSALEPVVAEACRQPDPETALLNLKVCDPACGSGNFLIAAARRIAYRLAFIRSGNVEADRETWCAAMRDVVRNCIYGVDSNEMAVELCRVSLSIEAIEPGKTLIFLEHRVKCGDSLIGATPALLQQGIPNSAFEPLEGDVRSLCLEYRKRNQSGQAGQLHLLIEPMDDVRELIEELQTHNDASYQDALAIKQSHEDALKRKTYLTNRLIADAWCAAFFWRKVYIQNLAFPFTQGVLRELVKKNETYRDMWEEIQRLAEQYQFFHWHLEFPDVFRVPAKGEAPENEQTGWSGGFDVVLGNPPWERIKLQEQEWFAVARPDIANAKNAALRHRKLDALRYEDPKLYAAFIEAGSKAERKSHFIRACGRYPLCGRGDVNIYAIFAEMMRSVVGSTGRVGCIVQSGIATDDTTKYFFRNLMESHTLVSLYSFINEAKLFPGIDHRVSFALLTVAGIARKVNRADFAFGVYQTKDLQEEWRHFSLSAADTALLNPNTLTCPIFRSKRDMLLTKAIYERVPVLIKEGPPEVNPWGIKFLTMFHMTNDSHLFRTREQLVQEGWKLRGNIFYKGEEQYLPLYEGKMVWHFDHRFGTYEGQTQAQANQGKLPELTPEQHSDPSSLSLSRYWVHMSLIPEFLFDGRNALLVFRDITNSVVLRTAIFSIIPVMPCGNNLPIAIVDPKYKQEMFFLAVSVSSFVFDYVARQKAGGSHMNIFILNQLPVLPPDCYREQCAWNTVCSLSDWLFPRAFELTYTAWDLAAFAKDCGYDGPPFHWDEERRFLLRCELDAAYFHLYGVARDDVDYIMETFRVWKEKEEKQRGEYRTKRVILEIYDEMQKAMETGEPYRTRLDPSPADPSVAHIIDDAVHSRP